MPEIAENFDSHDLRLMHKGETFLQLFEHCFQHPAMVFASRSWKRIRKVSLVLLIMGFTHVLTLLSGRGAYDDNFEIHMPQVQPRVLTL
jgi:hypothetical protein